MTDRRWTSPADLRRDLCRRWDSGAILAEVAGRPSMFPYRFRLTRPTVAELAPRYDEVRSWAAGLSGMQHVRVITSSQGARTIGRNDIPSEVWVDDIDAAAEMINRSETLASFRGLVEHTRTRIPELVDWLALHPIDGWSVSSEWGLLLDVVDWVRTHPLSNIYVRQVKLAGVNTKLIQRHSKVLTSMLDAVLPTDAFLPEELSFERRYGFRPVPQTVRVRTLDVRMSTVIGIGARDRPVTVTLEDFSQFRNVRRVFITENYVNFLSFPAASGSIVVFGEGYDVGKIAGASWVHQVPVFYWGDIDTHGFAILDLLRSKLPHVRSLLMDHATLHAHEAQWGEEQSQVRRDLEHLTRAERDLYDDLRDNRIRAYLRFEQELTSYDLIEAAVAGIAET